MKAGQSIGHYSPEKYMKKPPATKEIYIPMPNLFKTNNYFVSTSHKLGNSYKALTNKRTPRVNNIEIEYVDFFK